MRLPSQTITWTPDRAAKWIVAALCIFFFLAGRAFIPHLGLQNDEALFGGAIYEPRAGTYIVTFFGARLTLMLMSYLGTLKGWIYRQIFRVVRPSLSSIRTPVLLAGVATIWLFYRLLRRISGNRAAIFGCALLATDSIFLLTNTFDWGPVALQHLLLAGALLLVVVFYQDKSLRALAGAFFLLGLGLWDKALMIWLLAGTGCAALVVFPRQIRRAWSWKGLAVATLAFLLGALPLAVYNWNNQWETFRGNSSLEFNVILPKARLLASTLDGEALFGWMVAEDHEVAVPRPAATLAHRASTAISEAAGHPRHSLMPYALAFAILLTPLARGGERRAILFALVAMAVAWAQMAVTKNAGGSVHHAVLLWPLPHMAIAISFAAATRRLGRYALPAVAALLILVAGSNALVLNQYYGQTRRNGGSLNWNEAIVPLNAYLKDVRASNIFCVDWGILDSLRLLSRGRLPVRVGSDPVSKSELNAQDREVVLSWIREPDHVFIGHTEGSEFFPGTGAKLVRLAAEMNYQRELMEVIGDRYGRKFFEVYRFRAAKQAVKQDEKDHSAVAGDRAGGGR